MRSPPAAVTITMALFETSRVIVNRTGKITGVYVGAAPPNASARFVPRRVVLFTRVILIYRMIRRECTGTRRNAAHRLRLPREPNAVDEITSGSHWVCGPTHPAVRFQRDRDSPYLPVIVSSVHVTP